MGQTDGTEKNTGSDQNIYRQQRLENLRHLVEAGYRPSSAPFQRSGRLAEIRAGFQEGREVSAAGRVTALRLMGKSIFADLRDGSDRFQIFVSPKDAGEKAHSAFRRVDIGDHIGVQGTLFTTRMGEKTILVKEWTLLSKALLPLPEKWHGLKDVETRYRHRYLDLIANPDVRRIFDNRIRIIHEIRAFLVERGFVEVETPMLQPIAGGAAATPFVTHYEALGASMYLRIAPELYLKRLLVGGFDRIFELNRNFRNEGLSRNHVPEFTMMEIYEAYTDVRGMKALIEDLITHVAMSVLGSLKAGRPEAPVDLSVPWSEARYADLIRQTAGDDWYSLDVQAARRRVLDMGLRAEPDWNHLLLTHEIYEKKIEPSLHNPTFVTRLPSALVPLARPCEDDPSSADVFELVIAGQEVAPAYTEMNDPVEQRRKLLAQANGDASRLDEDFLSALEHGMPPAGGMGVGIDRLVMILLGAENIREVIFFPQLRPKE